MGSHDFVLSQEQAKRILAEIRELSPPLFRLIYDNCHFEILNKEWEFLVVHPAPLGPALRNNPKHAYNVRLAVTRATGHLFRVDFKEKDPN